MERDLLYWPVTKNILCGISVSDRCIIMNRIHNLGCCICTGMILTFAWTEKRCVNFFLMSLSVCDGCLSDPIWSYILKCSFTYMLIQRRILVLHTKMRTIFFTGLTLAAYYNVINDAGTYCCYFFSFVLFFNKQTSKQKKKDWYLKASGLLLGIFSYHSNV